jgi:hypothetical protein
MHANAPLIFRAPLNLVAPAVTHHKAVSGHEEPMKIACQLCLVWHWGRWEGAALGIGAGFASVEIFKTTSFEGDSGRLVFFTFMPLGAASAALCCSASSPFATSKSPSSTSRRAAMTVK